MRLLAHISTILFTGVMLAGGAAGEQDLVSTIDAYLTECHNRHLFNGSVLVARRDRVLFKKGYGYADMENRVPNTPDTIFRIGSITKQFTVVMILQLVEEGKVRLDGKLSEYIPEYRKDTGDRVTIDHLLRHTSGIVSYTNERGFWDNEIGKPHNRAGLIEKFHSGDLTYKPGARYAYNNTGYYLLGEIIERVTGRSYADNLRERITGDLEMTRTGVDREGMGLEKRALGYLPEGDRYVPEPHCHMPLISGCGDMYSTVEDLFKWNLALGTEKHINAESRTLMFKPYGNRFEGHAYGWDYRRLLLKRSGKRLTLAAFNGSLFGFMTDGIRVEEGEYFIALFNNTGQLDVWAISHALVNILYGEEYMFPVRR
jgi:CubicO group peptidase (beta-lactamase class C family)